jgi:hypothetical protein
MIGKQIEQYIQKNITKLAPMFAGAVKTKAEYNACAIHFQTTMGDAIIGEDVIDLTEFKEEIKQELLRELQK